MKKASGNEFPFYIENKLQDRLKKLSKRLDKRDIWVIIGGREGSGKTNAATYLMYWFHCMTGRNFTINNFYYDANGLKEFLQSTYNEMGNWDEAAMGGLSNQWFEREQLYLVQVGITCRIRHHIVIMCVPDFEKLKDYFINRANLLITMYVKNGELGWYKAYSPKRFKRLYKKLKKGSKEYIPKNFGGYCPEVFTKLFNEKEIKTYDKRKNEMIANIGKNPSKIITTETKELKDLKFKLYKLKFPINTKEEFADKLGLNRDTIRRWQKYT